MLPLRLGWRVTSVADSGAAMKPVCRNALSFTEQSCSVAKISRNTTVSFKPVRLMSNTSGRWHLPVCVNPGRGTDLPIAAPNAWLEQ